MKLIQRKKFVFPKSTHGQPFGKSQPPKYDEKIIFSNFGNHFCVPTIHVLLGNEAKTDLYRANR